MQQELASLRGQKRPRTGSSAPPSPTRQGPLSPHASPLPQRVRTDPVVQSPGLLAPEEAPRPTLSATTLSSAPQPSTARESDTASLCFAPTSATGVPNIQPGVDLDALLEERRHFRVKRIGDPSEKLDGKDRRAYRPWKRAVLNKIADNLPGILYHSEQINYAMSQLSGDLLYAMSNWVSQHNGCKFQAFIREMEGFLAIPLLQSEARREIDRIRQRQTENVTELYLRLTPYFTDANLAVDEQIDKFFIALRKSLSTQLACKIYSSLEDLRDDAQRLENRLHDLDATNSRSFSSQPSRNSGALKTSISGPNLSDEQKAANRQFGPVVDKPAGWQGPWFPRETKFPKLTPADRIKLQAQGRCFSCRGSGHSSSYAKCPLRLNPPGSKKFASLTSAPEPAAHSGPSQEN